MPRPSLWDQFVDITLQREALRCRMIRDIPASERAGIYVDDNDVESILRGLPGLRWSAPPDASWLDEQFVPDCGEVAEALHESLSVDTGPFGALIRRFAFDNVESELLLLVTGIEIEPARQRLLGYIQDDLTQPHLHLGTIERLFGGTSIPALQDRGRLTQSHLIRVEPGVTWAQNRIVPSQSLTWLVAVGEPPSTPPAPAWTWPIGSSARPPSVETQTDVSTDPVLAVHGGDEHARRRRIADETGGACLIIDGTEPVSPEILGHAAVTGLTMVLGIGDQIPTVQLRQVELCPSHRWALSSDRPLSLRHLPARQWIELDCDAAARTVGSTGHRLTDSDRHLVELGQRMGGLDEPGAIRRLAATDMATFAQELPVTHNREDLVLGEERSRQIDEIVDRYRLRELVHDAWKFDSNPSAGLVTLFTGPSGTGKTLAAEVIAGELGLALFRVDLSAVVSKWIGETEKHLSAVFDNAEESPIALFFDEADAMFGKRSGVKDSHDRYANVGVSHLLQRIERFDGLVMLATNLNSNIDSAFRRRIHVTVDFAVPEVEQREQIWRAVFPSSFDVDELNFGELAERFELTGGSIRNAALAAGFEAARSGSAVAMAAVVRSVGREMQKLGRLQLPENGMKDRHVRSG